MLNSLGFGNFLPDEAFVLGFPKPSPYSGAKRRLNGVSLEPIRGFAKLLHVPSKLLYLRVGSHDREVSNGQEKSSFLEAKENCCAM